MGALGPPPGMYEADRPCRYPQALRSRQILVDHQTLIDFMASAWGKSITDCDLNTLEYHGFLIPARKAIIDDLYVAIRTEKHSDFTISHSAKLVWEHRKQGWKGRNRRRRREGRPLTPERTFRLDLDEAHSTAPSWCRPTPLPVVRRESILMPVPHAMDMPAGALDREEHWPKGIHPTEPDQAFGIGELRKAERWLRPTDLAYWQVLGWNSCPEDPPSTRSSLNRLGIQALLKEPKVFQLDSSHAGFGNWHVTRLYAIGLGEWSSHKYNYRLGRLGAGPAQDWYLANLLQRLRLRLGTAAAIELVQAEQTKGINEPKAPYDNLRKRRKFYRQDPHFQLPPVIPHFYRDVLLKLAHQDHRERGISADCSFGRLAQAAGLSSEFVKRSVKRGARLIRGDSR